MNVIYNNLEPGIYSIKFVTKKGIEIEETIEITNIRKWVHLDYEEEDFSWFNISVEDKLKPMF